MSNKTAVFSINVNDRNLPIFKGKIERGPNTGDDVYMPDLSAFKSLEDIKRAFPEKELFDNILIPALKRFFYAASAEARTKDEINLATGESLTETDEQAIQASLEGIISNFSAQAESRATLSDRYEEMGKKISEMSLVIDPTDADQIKEYITIGQQFAAIEQALAKKKTEKAIKKANKEASKVTPEPLAEAA